MQNNNVIKIKLKRKLQIKKYLLDDEIENILTNNLQQIIQQIEKQVEISNKQFDIFDNTITFTSNKTNTNKLKQIINNLFLQQITDDYDLLITTNKIIITDEKN